MVHRKNKKRAGGRYTAPKPEASGPASPPLSGYRADDVMGTRVANITGDPDEHARQYDTFFGDAIWPTKSVVLFPTGPEDSEPLPPMLVVLLGVDEIDPPMRALINARASYDDPVAWHDSLRAGVGWTTLASISGDPTTDAANSYAKLNVRVDAPTSFEASFLFHLAQTLDMVTAVCEGGLFAIGTPEQIEFLQPQTLADALDMLPVIPIPRSMQLAMIVKHLQQA